MLAKTRKLAIIGLMVGSTALGSFTAQAQQLSQPSQRYQPTQVVQAPPSVHIAPQKAQRIPASYNFSDQGDAQHVSADDRYLIQQVAYQQPVAQAPAGTTEPAVPAILAGMPKISEAKAAIQQVTAPARMKVESVSQALNQFTPRATAEKSFNDFAPQMKQVIKTTTPRIAPEEISSQRAVLEAQLRAIQERTAVREAELASMGEKVAATAAAAVETKQVETKQVEQKPVLRAENQRQIVKAIPATLQPAATNDGAFSASAFVRDINGGSAEKTKINQVAYAAPQENKSSQSISRVSGNRATNGNAAIRLNAPSIEVETFGPREIGLNKPANYEVIVKNNSGSAAERILVGINLPEWVEVQNVNLTSGNKEITDGKDKARLVWTIDRIEAGRTQTATILAVPRKAEGFDVGVEWTLSSSCR